MLTKSWAAEYRPFGVRVNPVVPGPTLTDRVERNHNYPEGMLPMIPLRKFRTPEQVAAVVFLASDDAANIHGATLSGDGVFTTM